ncbi:hypothetical protein LPTSP4_07080 [Leptospira ryugenii]|uniref:Cell division inhibitor n=1 Tax=Leptospira ryugenii TaxID=1917863 RepID=A0A2P2DX34_9LEPT|nr:hypothetical protein [Leptospira ryugenii]GBF49198.1 hypothetical protein LPTSP4_07080 [Leptospira ryugenii]
MYFICKSEFFTSAKNLFAFHESPEGFTSLVAAVGGVDVLQRPISLQIGEVAILRVPVFPGIKLKWIAKHTAYESGKLFEDTQVKGPFLRFVHRHIMRDLPNGHSILEDRIDLQAPFWFVSRFIVLPILKRQFTQRHRITAQALDCPHHLMFCGYSSTVVD